MPRGKPFVCWIEKKGGGNRTALHIGDTVDLELLDGGGKIVRGKLGCHRKKKIFPYFVQVGSKRYQAGTITRLFPVDQEVVR